MNRCEITLLNFDCVVMLLCCLCSYVATHKSVTRAIAIQDGNHQAAGTGDSLFDLKRTIMVWHSQVKT